MGMGNKTIMLVLSIAVISLLVLSGCKNERVFASDLTTPPPLPEEASAEEEEEQPPAPPASTGQQSAPGQQPAEVPLLG